MNNALFPTVVFSNSASSSKLDELKAKILAVAEKRPLTHSFEGPDFGKLLSNRFTWEPSEHIELTKEVLSLLPAEVTENMIVDIAFYLQSFNPYQVHNDHGWVRVNDDELPFYIVVIPFETVDARTIILNQFIEGPVHKETTFIEYKENNSQLEEKDQISEEDFEKHFSHCWPQEKSYISIKDIFKWDAGYSLAADTRYFHVSDNYRKNNVNEKNCIVLMTKIKKNNYTQTLDKLHSFTQ